MQGEDVAIGSALHQFLVHLASVMDRVDLLYSLPSEKVPVPSPNGHWIPAGSLRSVLKPNVSRLRCLLSPFQQQRSEAHLGQHSAAH